jgi:hypothetical protein
MKKLCRNMDTANQIEKDMQEDFVTWQSAFLDILREQFPSRKRQRQVLCDDDDDDVDANAIGGHTGANGV